MTVLTEAQACVESAEANHLRLCQARERGEPVDVALSLAYRRLVKAKDMLAEIDSDTWVSDPRDEVVQLITDGTDRGFVLRGQSK